MTSGDQESERLTALGGLAALSLDALSSVAYGPEAILVVLVAAGTAGLPSWSRRVGHVTPDGRGHAARPEPHRETSGT